MITLSFSKQISQQGGLSRRRFLEAGSLIPLVALRRLGLPILGVSAAAVPSTVRAEPITICLAVGSAIAGLIAAHNRSDGGMGAVLKTTLEYQRNLTAQLASVQEGMAQVLARVDALPKEIQGLLRKERLEDLHAKFGGSIIRYRQEVVSRASTFPNYQAWMQHDVTRLTLADIDNQLGQAVAEVQRGRWLDPLTTLYLSAAAYAALGVRSALGEQPAQLKAEAQRYLDLFQLSADPREVGSSAAEMALRFATIEQLRSQLSKQGFPVSQDDAAATVDVRLGLVTIRDYKPRTLIKRSSDCRLRGRNPDFGEICWDTSTYASERNGPSETFEYVAAVAPISLEERVMDGPAISIRQFSVAQALTVRAAPGAKNMASASFAFASVRAETIPPVVAIEALTSEARLEASKTAPQFKAAEEARALLDRTISNLNLETAHVALCAGALVAASSTRQGMFKVFGLEA